MKTYIARLKFAKGSEDEGTLLANENVMVDGIEKSTQVWLKEIYGGSSVQTYVFASGKTLSQMREEYVEQLVKEAAEEV